MIKPPNPSRRAPLNKKMFGRVFKSTKWAKNLDLLVNLTIIQWKDSQKTGMIGSKAFKGKKVALSKNQILCLHNHSSKR